MDIKLFVVTIIAFIIFTTTITAGEKEDPSWDQVVRAASLISNNSQSVINLLSVAKNDININKEHSSFNKEALKRFEKKNTYYDFLEENTEKEEIPFAVFKTTMMGYGLMSYFDWKDISNSAEMTGVLNNMLNTLNIKKLTKDEITNINTKVNSKLVEPYTFKKQFLATNMMITTVGSIVKKRNYRVLWYIDISDSYSFFLVTPQVYEQLNNTQLGEDQEFKEPKFTLDGDLE